MVGVRLVGRRNILRCRRRAVQWRQQCTRRRPARACQCRSKHLAIAPPTTIVVRCYVDRDCRDRMASISHHTPCSLVTITSRNSEDIFEKRRLPRKPTVYVHAPDRPADRRRAPNSGPERLFCLVNAPARGRYMRIQNRRNSTECQESMLRLMKRCGLNLRWQPQEMVRTTPSDFNRRFPGTGGALYGRASHGWRASFQRPGSRTHLKGLYLAGGSVHPGPGVPMAALSGRLAAKCLVTDFVRKPRFHPVATIGGTSTAER